MALFALRSRQSTSACQLCPIFESIGKSRYAMHYRCSMHYLRHGYLSPENWFYSPTSHTSNRYGPIMICQSWTRHFLSPLLGIDDSADLQSRQDGKLSSIVAQVPAREGAFPSHVPLTSRCFACFCQHRQDQGRGGTSSATRL